MTFVTTFPYTPLEASSQFPIPPEPLIKMAIATPGKQQKHTIERVGRIVVVGRDLLNRVCVEFDGPALMFSIS